MQLSRDGGVDHHIVSAPPIERPAGKQHHHHGLDLRPRPRQSPSKSHSQCEDAVENHSGNTNPGRCDCRWWYLFSGCRGCSGSWWNPTRRPDTDGGCGCPPFLGPPRHPRKGRGCDGRGLWLPLGRTRVGRRLWRRKTMSTTMRMMRWSIAAAAGATGVGERRSAGHRLRDGVCLWPIARVVWMM